MCQAVLWACGREQKTNLLAEWRSRKPKTQNLPGMGWGRDASQVNECVFTKGLEVTHDLKQRSKDWGEAGMMYLSGGEGEVLRGEGPEAGEGATWISGEEHLRPGTAGAKALG